MLYDSDGLFTGGQLGNCGTGGPASWQDLLEAGTASPQGVVVQYSFSPMRSQARAGSGSFDIRLQLWLWPGTLYRAR